MKDQPVPSWVLALAVVLGLYCTLIGIVGLFDSGSVPEFVTGADNLGTAWAGRMAGTGVALLVAVGLRSAAAYAAGFAAASFRELGDLIVAGSGGSDGFPLVVVLIVLVADVAALAVSVKAAATAGASADA